MLEIAALSVRGVEASPPLHPALSKDHIPGKLPLSVFSWSCLRLLYHSSQPGHLAKYKCLSLFSWWLPLTEVYNKIHTILISSVGLNLTLPHGQLPWPFQLNKRVWIVYKMTKWFAVLLVPAEEPSPLWVWPGGEEAHSQAIILVEKNLMGQLGKQLLTSLHSWGRELTAVNCSLFLGFVFFSF